MQFSSIPGQEKLKQKLISSVKSGRIPHAQLFFGPEGSGSLPLAIAYAQYVACTGTKSDEACNTCPSCQKFNKLAHPDLHFSFPVNTTKRVSKDPVSDDFISEWREFVKTNPYFRASGWYNFIGLENKQGIINKKEGDSIVRKLSLKAYESEYKFMIIWLPEKMHLATANMLLKLIEEPPKNTLFLMVSEEPDQLMVTISSRTQPVKLEPIADEELRKALIHQHQVPESDLKELIRLANGNYLKAMELISQSEENAFNFESFTSLMRYCWKPEYLEVNSWVEEMSRMGREKLKSFFDYSLRMIRENLISNVQQPELVYLTPQEAAFSSKFHTYINGRNALQFYEEFNKASADIERNGYAKLVLFDLALHIMKLIRK